MYVLPLLGVEPKKYVSTVSIEKKSDLLFNAIFYVFYFNTSISLYALKNYRLGEIRENQKNFWTSILGKTKLHPNSMTNKNKKTNSKNLLLPRKDLWPWSGKDRL